MTNTPTAGRAGVEYYSITVPVFGVDPVDNGTSRPTRQFRPNRVTMHWHRDAVPARTGPWDLTMASLRGPRLLASGQEGTSEGRRHYYRHELPEWLAPIVDQYHPATLGAAQ